MEHSSFGRLPPELRCMVYDFASADAEALEIHVDKGTLRAVEPHGQGFSQVCRLTRAETAGRKPPERSLAIHIHAEKTFRWAQAADALSSWAQRPGVGQMLTGLTTMKVIVEIPAMEGIGYSLGLCSYEFSEHGDSERIHRAWRRLFRETQKLGTDETVVNMIFKFQQFRTLPTFEFEFPIYRLGFDWDTCQNYLDECEAYRLAAARVLNAEDKSAGFLVQEELHHFPMDTQLFLGRRRSDFDPIDWSMRVTEALLFNLGDL